MDFRFVYGLILTLNISHSVSLELRIKFHKFECDCKKRFLFKNKVLSLMRRTRKLKTIVCRKNAWPRSYVTLFFFYFPKTELKSMQKLYSYKVVTVFVDTLYVWS